VPVTVLLSSGKTQIVKLTAENPPVNRPEGKWIEVQIQGHTQALTHHYETDISSQWLGGARQVLYVECNSLAGDGYGGAPVAGKLLLNILQDEVLAHRPKFVIIDLRDNNGGNFANAMLFSQALPKMLPQDGKIFVLVGPGTFSAAIVMASLLKGHGGAKTVLIGEPMGDRGQFWAEGKAAWLRLPNSKLEVHGATQFEDWENGCDDLDRCFWVNVAFGVKGVSLMPEIQVARSFADYVAGRDAVLERAVSLAE
jgi:hypothetical protein